MHNKITTRLILLLCLLISTWASANTSFPIQAPNTASPVDVLLTLRVVKVFDVRPVESTFKIDTYVNYSWIDKRNSELDYNGRAFLVLEDSQVDTFKDNIWTPAFEIINNTGVKDISNRRLLMYPDGRVVYNERFIATLSSDMDFRLFPFDAHRLTIDIEPFSFDANVIRFSKRSEVFPSGNDNWDLTSWTVIDRQCYTSIENYAYLDASTSEDNFHRFSFELEVKRNPGYFLWQIMLPLLIIMMSSWMVFYVKDFSTQIGLLSTLLLTVYAFNFFISDSIPKLPYNTFLEVIIILSFVTIFLQLTIQLMVNYLNLKLRNSIVVGLFCLFSAFYVLIGAVGWHISKSLIDPLQQATDRDEYQMCHGLNKNDTMKKGVSE